ncbi:hypothetical protein [Streptomyces griseoflavus]|uniref:hypothetical protein n=1 Tax=Streptomyces griseoflavus TaxID=35619 RepID=UPI003D751ADA
MDHVDPAHLVELALGHATGDEDVGALRHIASCPRCREELRRTTRVVRSARGAESADLPAAPPEHVWQRIAGELSPGTAAPPADRSRPGRSACAVPAARAPGAGRRAVFLALAVVVGAVLLRRLRAGAGRASGGRRRPPWGRRAC